MTDIYKCFLLQQRYDYTSTFLCNQCNAGFGDFESFRTHIKLHIDETSSSSLLNGSALPEKKHSPVEFSCPYCRDIFASAEEVGPHIMTHFLSPHIAYSCENCRKSFDNSDELQKHLMEVHALHLYSCSICKEVFNSKVTIQVRGYFIPILFRNFKILRFHFAEDWMEISAPELKIEKIYLYCRLSIGACSVCHTRAKLSRLLRLSVLVSLKFIGNELL